MNIVSNNINQLTSLFTDPKKLDTYTVITTLDILYELCICLYNESEKNSLNYGIDQEMDQIPLPFDVSILKEIPFSRLLNLVINEYKTNSLFIIKVFKLISFLLEYRFRYFSLFTPVLDLIVDFTEKEFPFYNREYKGAFEFLLKAVSVSIIEDERVGVLPLERYIQARVDFVAILSKFVN